jgi:predicted SAM-dependent methyltransferase
VRDSRRIQLGCGPYRLPGWESFDSDVDIKASLPFPDECADYILAEHLIEHIPFADGFRFLFSCWRVLKPGGVLRLSFPDVTRTTEEMAKAYSRHVKKFGRKLTTRRDVVRSILSDWGHVSCWTLDGATIALESYHFKVRHYEYGQSEIPDLVDIDQRHKAVGLELAKLESTILEAQRL